MEQLKHHICEIENDLLLENVLHIFLSISPIFPTGIVSNQHGRFGWLIAQSKGLSTRRRQDLNWLNQILGSEFMAVQEWAEKW